MMKHSSRQFSGFGRQSEKTLVPVLDAISRAVERKIL